MEEGRKKTFVSYEMALESLDAIFAVSARGWRALYTTADYHEMGHRRRALFILSTLFKHVSKENQEEPFRRN